MRIIKTGNAIVRQYKAAKFLRNSYAGVSGMDFVFGAQDAINHDIVGTGLMYLCTCYFAKRAAQFHQQVSLLKPEYQKIVQRAREIYLKK